VLAFALACRSLGTMIKRLSLHCLFAAVLFAAAGVPAADKVLTAKAKVSTAELRPRDAKLRQIALPALDVVILVELACPLPSKAASLTVSVADTFEILGAELLADVVSMEAALAVPASQLAPINATGFCVAGATTEDLSLSLAGVATAQVSLHCQGEDDVKSAHFASAPVPVTLYCRADDSPETSSADR
jgi:hypothetical protein